MVRNSVRLGAPSSMAGGTSDADFFSQASGPTARRARRLRTKKNPLAGTTGHTT